MDDWWEYLPVAYEIINNAFCQEKNGLPGMSLVLTILALRNEATWSGFLWYLAVPSCEEYVHYVASRPNPLKVKVNSERVWDIVISH